MGKNIVALYSFIAARDNSWEEYIFSQRIYANCVKNLIFVGLETNTGFLQGNMIQVFRVILYMHNLYY